MYERSAKYYDAVYRSMGKDYERESASLHDHISKRKKSSGTRLLDVACGSGLHLSHLRSWYDCEGMDLSEPMLQIARERCPNMKFHRGDMMDFALGRQFDGVTCLFSAIGHAKNEAQLRSAIQCMANHLEPGGVLVIEPWLLSEDWQSDRPWMHTVDEPDLKLARINVSKRRGDLAILDFHYVVGTPEGVESFTEYGELGLFTHEQYLAAIEAAGLETDHDEKGLFADRGLYFGIKPRKGENR